MAASELDRLIDRVARDVDARLAAAGAREAAVVSPVARAAHADRSAKSLTAVIDHTLLRPDATRAAVRRLCAEAREFGFAAVCVSGGWVATAASLLEGGGVGLCAAVGFPLGAMAPEVKTFEARTAVSHGASEVDVVMNIGAVKSGDLGWALRDLQDVVETCRASGVPVKAILETALLTDAEKISACLLAARAGAAFVKTSTGFGPGGATVDDVRLLGRVVGTTLGVKAAGGIRDLATARAMIGAGATRIGTSAGVRIAQAERAEVAATNPPRTAS